MSVSETTRVRLFAAAKAAVGMPETDVPAGGSIADALHHVSEIARDPATAARVFARCSFRVDARATTDSATMLPAGSTLDVLPPFAGG